MAEQQVGHAKATAGGGRAKSESGTPHGTAANRISSPDQLTDYLRVTNPGIWVLLASIILFLAGIFVWFSIGILETETPVKVSVEGQKGAGYSTRVDSA